MHRLTGRAACRDQNRQHRVVRLKAAKEKNQLVKSDLISIT